MDDIYSKQRALFDIAVKQNSNDSLIINDSKNHKSIIYFDMNKSSKTAIPILMISDDSINKKTTRISSEKDLYYSISNLIEKHNNPNIITKYSILKENLSNTIKNNSPHNAINIHPELSLYYKTLESIKEKSKSFKGQNKQRFIEASKHKSIEYLTKKTILNERLSVNEKGKYTVNKGKDIER